jgi:hypothetical protein
VPVKKINHCFSVYFPPEKKFELKLAQILAKTSGKSISSIMRILLKKALQDNGLMDVGGNSLVKGIKAPDKEKRKAILKKSTNLEFRRE